MSLVVTAKLWEAVQGELHEGHGHRAGRGCVCRLLCTAGCAQEDALCVGSIWHGHLMVREVKLPQRLRFGCAPLLKVGLQQQSSAACQQASHTNRPSSTARKRCAHQQLAVVLISGAGLLVRLLQWP